MSICLRREGGGRKRRRGFLQVVAGLVDQFEIYTLLESSGIVWL
jgi:hypothetical protein